MKKPKCAIAGRVCPQNGDPTQGDFCPCWTEGLKFEDPQTGLESYRADCYLRHLYVHVDICRGESILGAKIVQRDRREQQKALDAVEQASRAMGAPKMIEQLASLGLRAAVGHHIVAATALSDGGNSVTKQDGITKPVKNEGAANFDDQGE